MSETGKKSEGMKLFKITGVDSSGTTKSIALEAADERQAVESAKRKGIYPTQVTQVKRQAKDKSVQPPLDDSFSKAIEDALGEKTADNTSREQDNHTSAPRQSRKPATAKDIEYDPAIIQQYARRMYKKAERIIAEFTIAGAIFFVILGCLIMTILAGPAGHIRPEGLLAVIVISFLIGAYLGYHSGVCRAFWLRIAAHKALCQMHIEENTRSQ
jgi:hypothetical protein